jgi:hypothetical protein
VLPVRDGPFEVRELRPDPHVLVTAADSDVRGLAPAARELVETACQLEGGGRNSTSCSPASATTASGV